MENGSSTRSAYVLAITALCIAIAAALPGTAEAQDWPDEPNYPDMTKEETRQYAERVHGPLDEREQAAVQWAFKLQPSVLNMRLQVDELMWYAHNADALRDVSISSVAETIKTHKWESEVLAQAFSDITGIDVTHNIIGEGSLVEKLQTQIASGRKVYDIYVNDADLNGTHARTDGLVNLSNYTNGAGSEVTSPTHDFGDFLNLEFGQNFQGEQIQLPDQQFANLYWFRHDWFTDPQIKQQFQERYGYELGVPRNWAAYEDIAEFFTKHVSPEDVGASVKEVYGHMDYGKRSPSLGWRFTDAWLSIAGVGDEGLPNGRPVDEWGIRMEDNIPVGSSVDRGGATNGPAAYYATRKYVDWLNDYAPPFASSMRWSEAGPVPSRGNIAQRAFQYITFLAAEPFTAPGSEVTDDEGNPLWRMAPTPHGRYWDEGMKVGYQDVGSWTIPKLTKGDARKAAWLWAQFCTSKSVALKKFNVGKTPIRESTVNSAYWNKHEGELGGLITFYKSPVEDQWTDTGLNVPNYPLLAEQWWKQIAQAVSGGKTVEQAMNDLASIQNSLMGRLRMEEYSPELNEPRSREYWLNEPGAPKAERPPEDPVTMPYDELVQQWQSSEGEGITETAGE
jgi:glycerol transport system substrate-binding protein